MIRKNTAKVSGRRMPTFYAQTPRPLQVSAKQFSALNLGIRGRRFDYRLAELLRLG